MRDAGGTTGVVITLGLTQTLAWGSTYYLPAILAVPIAKDLELSPELVFGAFSAALIISAFLGPAAGRRIDTFGGRDVLALSNLLFAGGLTILGFTNDAPLLFTAWLVLGIGMSLGLYEAAFATLAGLYGGKARGPITGITLLAGFASTVCWPISAFLEAEYGWRIACFVWAGAHLLFALPLNRLLIPVGTWAKAPKEPNPATALSKDNPTGGNREMILLAIVFTIVWFTSTAMAAHLPRLLLETGATPGAAIAAAALVGPAQVAGRLIEFGILKRYHPLLSARLAAMAHPVGAALLLWLGAAGSYPFTLLHGAGNGILTIAKGTLPLAIFGPTGYGLRQGLLMIPARFGQAGAPLLFIVLMERWGADAVLLTASLGLIAATALLALTSSRTPN
jgi:MFS family permease